MNAVERGYLGIYDAKLEQAQQHLAALDRLRIQVAEAIAVAQAEVLRCQREVKACKGELRPEDYIV